MNVVDRHAETVVKKLWKAVADSSFMPKFINKVSQQLPKSNWKIFSMPLRDVRNPRWTHVHRRKQPIWMPFRFFLLRCTCSFGIPIIVGILLVSPQHKNLMLKKCEKFIILRGAHNGTQKLLLFHFIRNTREKIWLEFIKITTVLHEYWRMIKICLTLSLSWGTEFTLFDTHHHEKRLFTVKFHAMVPFNYKYRLAVHIHWSYDALKREISQTHHKERENFYKKKNSL